jgi:glutathione S-transferase/maleylpyruvate isomerase
VTDYETRLKEFEVVSGELEAYRPAMDAYLEKAKPA